MVYCKSGPSNTHWCSVSWNIKRVQFPSPKWLAKSGQQILAASLNPSMMAVSAMQPQQPACPLQLRKPLILKSQHPCTWCGTQDKGKSLLFFTFPLVKNRSHGHLLGPLIERSSSTLQIKKPELILKFLSLSSVRDCSDYFPGAKIVSSFPFNGQL